MQIYSEWFDSAKLIHLDKHPDILNSENGPLFSAEFHRLYYELYGVGHPYLLDSITTVNPNPGVFKPSAAGGEHFSHDNMTGLYCLYFLAFSKVPRHLPITSKYVKHPRDILFYLYCHSLQYEGYLIDIWRHILLMIPSLTMLISCYQLFKVRNGNKIYKTDGKILTWLRCKTFRLNKTLWCAEKIIKYRGHWKSWGHIFSAYFKRIDHPINKISSTIYKGF